MYVRPEITETVGRSVMVTGAARSGTTLMGNLIHSLEGYEYLFEPPMMFALLPLLATRTDKDRWRMLFETYLFEDFLMDALAGRRMNLNEEDDSYIGRAKSHREIDNRLSSRYRRADLVAQAVGHRIAFKCPDMLPYIWLLHRCYPAMKFIIMYREPEAVVESLRQKGWFDPAVELSRRVQGPWQTLGPDVPFWLGDAALGADHTEWLKGDELHRCYHYWLTMYGACRRKPWALVVDYDELVRHPDWQFGRVLDYLGGAEAGPKTEDLLAGVRPMDPEPEATICRLEPLWKERVDQTVRLCETLADREVRG